MYFTYPYKFILIKNNSDFNINFQGIKKINIVKKTFKNIFPVILLNNINKKRNIIEFSENGYDIKYDFDDTGIDTYFIKNDSLYIKFKNFVNKSIKCSLKIVYKDNNNIYAINSDSFAIENKSIKEIHLLSNDKNDYNEHIILNSKPTILILSNQYSKELQNFSFTLSGLYNNFSFYSGIYRNNKIISSVKDYDLIITNTSYSNKNTLFINDFNIENNIVFSKIDSFLLYNQTSKNFIKNPFHKAHIYYYSLIDYINQYLFIIIIIFFILMILIKIF